ncbi:MAG: DNA repair protein RecO [Clostridia bacterium]|nr:DNA repair protein RecO [Clostridia bacterium]
MDQINTKAIVLRTAAFGDYDKMLTLLGETTGKISVAAKGGKSLKHGAGCSNFCYSDFIISKKTDRYTMSQVSPIETFSGLSTDLDALNAAAKMLKFTEYVCPEGEPQPLLLRTLLNTLYAMANSKAPVNKCESVFYFKALSLLGFTPELDGCSACGEESSLCSFSVEYGGVLCSECAGSVEDKIPVTAEAVAVMKYIIECDIKKLFSFTASDASLAEVKKIADKFTKHYLDF